MRYNFDKPVNRIGVNSVKWDKYSQEDMIPLWIADMDFESSDEIVSALNQVTNHQVFGYTNVSLELLEVVVDRLKVRHQWEVRPEWIVWLPGLVPGLTLSTLAATTEKESVLTTVPVYGPFVGVPDCVARVVEKLPVVLVKDRWTIDFDQLEKVITPTTKLFLLCNPYNPAGTVFTKEELLQLGEICLKHGIIICADEIHCDLIIDPSINHVSIASLSSELEQSTITLLAPSKTFNIAGLGCSFAVIPNDELRLKFEKLRRYLLPGVSVYAAEAALAAYKSSEQWHHELLVYLKSNHDYLLRELNAIPGFKMLPHEATYLAWIDISELKLENPIETFEKIGVGVQDGAFSFEGPGFVRLNFGTTMANLKIVVERLKSFFL